MPLILRALALGSCLVPLGTGCGTIRAVGKSPLAAATMPRESIAVEKFSVRFPHGDVELNDTMWSEIDEESLPADVRARLAANGFRAGIIGGHLPAALDRVLRDDRTTAPEPPPPEVVQGTDVEAPVNFAPRPVDLLHEPTVRRSLWHTRAGHAGIVITAGEHARIPRVAVLVRNEEGRVSGRSYEKVMAALSMKAYSESDGRVRLELVPELEYGDPRSRFIAADGMIKPDYRPETVVFQELSLMTMLSPGQTLILAARAEKPGSLGHHFFTEQGSAQPLSQKLLLMRLAQAPADDRFRSDEVPLATP